MAQIQRSIDYPFTAPAVRPSGRAKRYHPVRPFPNLSNYQVNYSLPRWQ